MIFMVLKFPKVRYVHSTGEMVHYIAFRWHIHSVFFSNIFIKKLLELETIVEIIVGGWVLSFLRHSVVPCGRLSWLPVSLRALKYIVGLSYRNNSYRRLTLNSSIEQLKAKFHYAIWFEVEAGSKLVRSRSPTSFEPASVMEFGFQLNKQALYLTEANWTTNVNTAPPQTMHNLTFNEVQSHTFTG